MVNTPIIHRKGARKLQDIPQEVLALLNVGEIETVNLTEWLAVEHSLLISVCFPTLGFSQKQISILLEIIKVQPKPSTMNTIKIVGSKLFEICSQEGNLDEAYDKLSEHTSDSIRCYAPYLVALNGNLSIEEKLNKTKKLVADPHFGVREVVWMALRPEIEQYLGKSISFLSQWAGDKNENVRRFTTEVTRPRGVWCKHIEILKENPEIALPILEKLKTDPSKYVQDSVGNWLHDASKTRPEFVIELCEKWQKESCEKATEKIIKKARRTIDK